MKKLPYVLLLLILLTFIASLDTVFSQDSNQPASVILTNEQTKYPLGLHLEYLEDPTGELTITQVSAPEYSAQFIPSREEMLNFGINPNAHWVRFRLQNQSDLEQWLLEVALPPLDYVDLYLPRPDGTYQRKAGGDLVPFARRDVPHHNIAFSLPLTSSTETTYYMRFQNKARLVIAMDLWQPAAFTWPQKRAMFGFGLFYGVVLIMTIYNLFLSSLVRDRLYLFYAVFLLILGLVLLTFDGLAYQYLWPGLPYWNDVALYALIGLGMVIILLFSTEFLQLKHYYSRLHKLMIGLAVWWAGLSFVYIFVTQHIGVNLAINPGLVPVAILLVGTGWAVWRRGYQPAKYYLLFWGILAVATIVQNGSFIQLLPVNVLTENAMRIGLVIALPFLSLALADRVNLTRREKEMAQAAALEALQEKERLIHEHNVKLEQYVTQRTAELTQANQYLQDEITERERIEQEIRKLSWAVEQSPSTVIITDTAGHIEYVNPRFTQTTGFPIEEIMGKTPRFLKSGQHSQGFYQQLWNTILGGKEWHGEFVNRKKNGELYWELASITPVRNAAGETTHFLKVAEDITDRVQMEQSLETVYRELAALFTFSTNMTSTLELRPLLALILDRLQNVVDFSSATVITLDGENAEVYIHAGSRQRLDRTGFHFNLTRAPLLADYMARHEILYIPDASTLPDFVPNIERIITQSGQVDLSYLHSWLFIPLVIRDKVIGLLLVVHEEKDFYNERMREFMQAFANQMALAIENSRLYQQAQEVAVSEERTRLARDLHDSVTQTLYSINLFTNAAQLALTAGNTTVVQDHLAELSELITEALLDMRLLIFELRPPVLEELGLVAALQHRLEAVEGRAGITVDFAAEGQNNLPLTTQAELYRVAQEALTNIVKHAGAENIIVRLQFTDHHAVLTIQDNGTGFNLKNVQQSGKLGLRSMAERIEKINGKLQITSAPTQGTTLTVDVDLRSTP